jgi:hypothetical protein
MRKAAVKKWIAIYFSVEGVGIDLPNTLQAIAHTLAIHKRFGDARHRRQQELRHIQALKRVLLATNCRVRSISISRIEITILQSSPVMDTKKPETQL